MTWIITTIALPAIAVAAFWLGVRSGCRGGRGCGGGSCPRGDEDDRGK